MSLCCFSQVTLSLLRSCRRRGQSVQTSQTQRLFTGAVAAPQFLALLHPRAGARLHARGTTQSDCEVSSKVTVDPTPSRRRPTAPATDDRIAHRACERLLPAGPARGPRRAAARAAVGGLALPTGSAHRRAACSLHPPPSSGDHHRRHKFADLLPLRSTEGAV